LLDEHLLGTAELAAGSPQHLMPMTSDIQPDSGTTWASTRRSSRT
jgi:hypothetical protein